MPLRLKSFELQGYKTFASRNLFEYSSRITAIVGPNGAGKSNVADALRWVLGEQSYTLLRGRKTEDMIFAGSDQRARASMASSMITFDNQDGWLPIDYSEVSISRRAYRDGQNEYLLNGQKVRLKEISELLAKSGLAERTYTIIGQGLVDTALSLRPEERRRFFEEAAGIGLYRARREEALNRLDSTRRNLERVQDILSELEPRLRSLEKQASKVREYERIKADLHLLLRDWYGYYWHRLQQELVQAQEVFRIQEERLLQARLKLERVNEATDQIRGRLHILRQELNAWHADLSKLHSQSEIIGRNQAVLVERYRALTEQLLSLKSDQTRIGEQQIGQNERIMLQQVECTLLQSELDEAHSQSQSAQQKLSQRKIERDQAEQSLRTIRHKLTQLETQQVQKKAHQGELSRRLDNLRQSQQSTSTSISNERKSLQTASEELEKSQQEKNKIEGTLKDAEELLRSLRNLLEDVDRERKKAQDHHTQLATEKARASTQIQVLEQAEKSYSGFNQGARFLLESVQKGHLQGRYRALSTCLEVPPEYEVAIAAVLGEHLDGVLLDSDGDDEQAMVLLEEGVKGRAVLIPNRLKTAVQTIGLVEADCLGIAADLVKAPEEIKPLINQLLGDVLITQDRKTARRIVGKLPPTARAVTLKGEVFWGSGIVAAGQEGRSGMIARPRQKREFQEVLEQTDNALQHLGETLQKQQAEMLNVRSQIQDQEKNLRAYNQQLIQANQKSLKNQLEVDQIRQRSDWQGKQLVSLEKQIEETNAEIQNGKTELEHLVGQISEVNQLVREHSRKLNSLSTDEMQTELNNWNTNAAVTARAVSDAQKRLTEYTHTLTANEQLLQSICQRIDTAQTSLELLDHEQSDLNTQEATLNGLIRELQERTQPAEKNIIDVEKEYAQYQADQSAAQQALVVAERFNAQAQMELSHRRDALDNLRRRIEDDFGLVMFEYNQKVTGPTPLPFDGMVAELPVIQEIPHDLEENINRQKTLIRRMGAINLDAHNEYVAVQERYEFMTGQVQDLHKADADLRKVITELDDLMRREFHKTFQAVANEFHHLFTRLFGGGTARLVLTDEDNPNESGIDIEARLPGRREQGLSLLSGGERSLTAVALIFSLLKVSPTPFCVMDEVDAMLDESNVGRFCELLKELSERTQFILITHNRNTVQTADVIYGVTMGRDSSSQVISLRLDELNEELVQ